MPTGVLGQMMNTKMSHPACSFAYRPVFRAISHMTLTAFRITESLVRTLFPAARSAVLNKNFTTTFRYPWRQPRILPTWRRCSLSRPIPLTLTRRARIALTPNKLATFHSRLAFPG